MLSCKPVGNHVLQNYSTIYIFGAEGNLGSFSTGKSGWEVRGNLRAVLGVLRLYLGSVRKGPVMDP